MCFHPQLISTSKNWPASPTGAAGTPTAGAGPGPPRGSDTDTSTPPSTTAPEPWHAEIHGDETAAAAGFLERTVREFTRQGIRTERVLIDNGPCYRSGLWARTCARLGVKPKHTRPYRPQTNGKIKALPPHLHRGMGLHPALDLEQQRHEAFQHYIHYYNHHRPHGALGWATPIETLQALTRGNLPELHIYGTASSGRGLLARPPFENAKNQRTAPGFAGSRPRLRRQASDTSPGQAALFGRRRPTRQGSDNDRRSLRNPGGGVCASAHT